MLKTHKVGLHANFTSSCGFIPNKVESAVNYKKNFYLSNSSFNIFVFFYARGS